MVSKKVYIATDALVAFIDRGHQKHIQSAACFRYFSQNSYQLFTTIVMLNEVYYELYMSISPSVARDFMRAVELSSLNVLYPEDSDCKRGFRSVISSQSVDLTFSKALMAVICNKRSIPQIFTFEYMPTLFGLQAFYLPV